MKKYLTYIILLMSLPTMISVIIAAERPSGVLKAGYVYTDETGNEGVYQPSYNLYDGLALSLEDFKYKLENGTRLFGDFKNVTLENRNLVFGAAKTGLFNARVSHNQYRRIYSFDESRSTDRKNSSGNFWAQAHKNVRVFGGYGQIDKSGHTIDLTEPTGFAGVNQVDYSQKYYHAGTRLNYQKSYLELSYRGSDFKDNLNSTNDRKSVQFRATASTPVPRLEDFYVHGGFQHFEVEVENINDTLTANTGWGGVRYFNKEGYHAKYSFIWDRARRATELAATDNITNAVYVGKEWRGQGGLTVGYIYCINDDIFDELKSNGYSFSGWLKPHDRLTLRAGYGAELTDVEAGSTLTGDKDYTRYNASAAYKFKYGTWRAKFENKQTENEDIGSAADFTRLGTDISINVEDYGEITGAYDYLNGDYENAEGKFEFTNHVLWWDFVSRRYKEVQLGAGGTYVRSREDLDIENFSLRFSGNYKFLKFYRVEVVYSAYNYDDFNDPSVPYSRYYTANIVEMSLSREF
jgi:hypothetical protein